MAKRRRSTRRRRNPGLVVPNPRRHARRRHRRNPFGISTGGIVGSLKRGATGGLGVLAGRVGSRLLPDLTGVSSAISGGGMGSVTATAALAGAQLAAGVIVAMLAKSAFGSEAGALVMAGAFDGVYEDIGTSMGSVPVIGPYLGGYSATLPVVAQAAIRGYSRTAAVRGYGASAGKAQGRSALRRIGIGGGRVAR